MALLLLISGSVLMFRWWNHADRAVAGGQEAPVAAAFVIDTSPRMQYRQGKETRLDAALELATWLMPQVPANSDIVVLDSSGNSGGFAADRRAAQQRIDRLAPTMVAQPLPQVIEEALRRLDESEHPRKELYIFTDLARSAWSSTATERLREKLKELNDIGVYVIDVGARAAELLAERSAPLRPGDRQEQPLSRRRRSDARRHRRRADHRGLDARCPTACPSAAVRS